MTLSPTFLSIASIALFTNGMALLGQAQESAGALARALESREQLSRSIETEAALQYRHVAPPCPAGSEP